MYSTLQVKRLHVCIIYIQICTYAHVATTGKERVELMLTAGHLRPFISSIATEVVRPTRAQIYQLRK